MTPASTIRARAPAVVRSMGWGATGRGAWERRAPQESQWRLKGGLRVPHEGQGTPVGGPPWPPPTRAGGLLGTRRHTAGLAGRGVFELEGLEAVVEGLVGPVVHDPHLGWCGGPARSAGAVGVLCHGCRLWRRMRWRDPAGRGLVVGNVLGALVLGTVDAGPDRPRLSCHSAAVASSSCATDAKPAGTPAPSGWASARAAAARLPLVEAPSGPGAALRPCGPGGAADRRRARRRGAPPHRHRRGRPGARRGAGARRHAAGRRRARGGQVHAAAPGGRRPRRGRRHRPGGQRRGVGRPGRPAGRAPRTGPSRGAARRRTRRRCHRGRRRPDPAPTLLVVDSIQTVAAAEVGGTPGAWPRCARRRPGWCTSPRRAGCRWCWWAMSPRTAPSPAPGCSSMPSMWCSYLEGDVERGLRVLRSLKNRFGATHQVGLFEMGDAGMQPVADPSGWLVAGFNGEVSGSVVFPSVDGRRPLLVEVQALVSPRAAPFAAPQRAGPRGGPRPSSAGGPRAPCRLRPQRARRVRVGGGRAAGPRSGRRPAGRHRPGLLLSRRGPGAYRRLGGGGPHRRGAGGGLRRSARRRGGPAGGEGGGGAGRQRRGPHRPRPASAPGCPRPCARARGRRPRAPSRARRSSLARNDQARRRPRRPPLTGPRHPAAACRGADLEPGLRGAHRPRLRADIEAICSGGFHLDGATSARPGWPSWPRWMGRSSSTRTAR